MTHVLILSLDFPPDNVSTGHLMGDLAGDLVKRGYKVTVVTTRPHAQRDMEAEERQLLSWCWWFVLGKSEYGGAQVYHTFMMERSSNIASRLLAWSIFHVISLFAGLLIPRRVDVILTPSPLLSLGIIAWLFGLRHQCRFVYNVQDLHPDSAIRMGRINNRSVRFMLYRLERLVYSFAGAITCITPEIREIIVGKGISSKKVFYIPNWVDIERVTPADKVNPFSVKHGFESKFLVSYAGNMGPAQCFEEFLEAACILKSETSVRFLLVGGGAQSEQLSRAIVDRNLTNVTMLPFQSQQQMPMIYGSSDLSFVTLLPELGSTALPSKVYRIMSSAIPVLAIAKEDSGLAGLINQAGCGVVVRPGSGKCLAGAIKKFTANPELVQEKGLAGRRWVEEHYSRAEVVSKYVGLFDDLT